MSANPATIVTLRLDRTHAESLRATCRLLRQATRACESAAYTSGNTGRLFELAALHSSIAAAYRMADELEQRT
jgi:hypothetical protein